MISARSIGSHAAAEDGFTLIEVLVAMISGTVVVGALVVILQVTANQTARIRETSQANQLGRTTMTNIVDELHSACLGVGFVPVQSASTEQKLRFITGYSESAVVPSSAVAEHEIVWNEAAQTLTDTSYAATSGEGTSFVFPASATSTRRIGEKITKGQGSTPVFRYYKYATTGASSSSSTPVAALEVISTSETTALGTEAKNVAAVGITFKAGAVGREELLASEAKAKANLPTELSSQVTFAFSAPESETTIVDSPCR